MAKIERKYMAHFLNASFGRRLERLRMSVSARTWKSTAPR